MVNGGADEFREEQVRAALDSNAHGLINARPRIEHDEAVRRGPEHAVQGRGGLLMPPRESPRPSRLGYGTGEPVVKAVRRRYRPGLAEFRDGARDCQEGEVIVDDDHSEL